MKYLLLPLLLTISVLAQPSHEVTLEVKSVVNSYLTAYTICAEGYLYIVAVHPNGVGVTQMYRKSTYSGDKNPPQPIECKQ